MITSNVINRVFHIKYDDGTGTAFTIDVNERQYLITAKHVIEGFPNKPLEIYHEGQWKNIDCNLVGHGQGNIDVSVLAPSLQLSPNYNLPATSGNIVYGQTVFFLGFPYGLKSDLGKELMSDFPLPIVKSGVMSSIMVDNDEKTIWLDGHNNPGFSGGPIVFLPNAQGKEFNVAGIVSAYPTYPEPVVDSNGKETGLYTKNNPGIIIGYNISHATDIIDKNPIGFPIKNS